MAVIMDYLDWRGDLPFSLDSFNEVDGYILAKFGCPDYTGAVPDTPDAISIGSAVKQYFALHGEEEGEKLGVLASSEIIPAIRRLVDLPRYREIKAACFVQRLDENVSEQFSALSLLLPDGTVYVTFRGTDDTLLGWKENLMMSVRDVIPAQQDALDYLEKTAAAFSGPLIVGGHSKGGNLAVYASANASPSVKDRIKTIYNYDGPGFAGDFFSQDGYQSIRSRIRTYLPQYSIIGMLLPREEDVTIVSSTRAGAAAHDGFQWEVLGTGFIRCTEFSRSTQAFETSMQTVLQNMVIDERVAFIDELFDTLSATGAKTITDVTEMHVRKALALGKDIYHKPEVHRFVSSLIELMIKDYKSKN